MMLPDRVRRNMKAASPADRGGSRERPSDRDRAAAEATKKIVLDVTISDREICSSPFLRNAGAMAMHTAAMAE